MQMLHFVPSFFVNQNFWSKKTLCKIYIKKKNTENIKTPNFPFLVQIWLIDPIVKTKNKISKNPYLSRFSISRKILSS